MISKEVLKIKKHHQVNRKINHQIDLNKEEKQKSQAKRWNIVQNHN